MNERKQNHREYYNPTQTKQNKSAEELLFEIKMFMTHVKLTPTDFFMLNKLIRQLNAQKNTMPGKVIRGLETKFNKIKNQYQR